MAIGISFVSRTIDPTVLPSVDTWDVEDPIEYKDGVVVDEEIDCTGLIVDISLAFETSFVSNTVVNVVLPMVDTLGVEDPTEYKDGVEVDDEIDCTALIVNNSLAIGISVVSNAVADNKIACRPTWLTVGISLATGPSFVSSTAVPILLPSVDALDMEDPIEYKDGVEVDDEIDCTGLIVNNSLVIGISVVSNTVVDDKIDCTWLTVDISLAPGTSFLSSTVVPIVSPSVDTS